MRERGRGRWRRDAVEGEEVEKVEEEGDEDKEEGNRTERGAEIR